MAESKVERERRRRINVALWAYAYEKQSDTIVDDATFDRVCSEIDLSISTGNAKMDKWFSENFQPWTGAWVHNHPEIMKLEVLYLNLNTRLNQKKSNRVRYIIKDKEIWKTSLSLDIDLK